MILIVDNFDSFTYNLVDYFNQLGEECEVIRNDVPPKKLDKQDYSAVVLSPGPGKPEDAGFLMDYLKEFEDYLPILGICLGHQAIAKYYGADIVKAIKPMHGKISKIHLVSESQILDGLPSEFNVVRYHSLIVQNLKNTALNSLAATSENENMIFSHSYFPIFGIQYHPEAALTQYGLKILKNWISLLETNKEAILNKLL